MGAVGDSARRPGSRTDSQHPGAPAPNGRAGAAGDGVSSAAVIQLTDAEAAFRIHKSDLSIRPIWHQREDRVQAHILVCFLAYVLWKTLEQWQSRAGLGHSPRTILEELRRIQSTDVVLPTAEPAESLAQAANSASGASSVSRGERPPGRAD